MHNIEKTAFLGNTKRTFLLQGLVISDVEYHHPVSQEWHSHKNPHLSLILSGGNCEYRKGKEIQVLPGCIIPYNPGEIHQNLHTKHPSKNLNFEFEPCFFEKYELDFTAFNNTIQPDFKYSLLKAYHESMINDRYSEVSIQLSLLPIFHKMNLQDGSSNKAPAWLNTLQEILQDRWDEYVSLNELSSILNIHPVTISKYFPRHFKCTLGEYMRKIKVDRAFLLMENSHTSLSEIAYLCGFSDQSHFFRTFKYLTGFSPKEYRHL